MKEYEFQFNYKDIFLAPRLALSPKKIWVLIIGNLSGFIIYWITSYISLILSGIEINVAIADMSASALGTATGTTGVDLTTAGLDSVSNAQTAIISIDNAIDSVSTARGGMGAVSNRLSSTMSNLDQIAVNLSAF